MEARHYIIERIKVLDARVCAAAKQNSMARLFMTAPSVGAVITLSVASTYDNASRFRRSSSAGAYLGLTTPAQTLRIRRGQSKRPRLEARRQADANQPSRRRPTPS